MRLPDIRHSALCRPSKEWRGCFRTHELSRAEQQRRAGSVLPARLCSRLLLACSTRRQWPGRNSSANPASLSSAKPWAMRSAVVCWIGEAYASSSVVVSPGFSRINLRTSPASWLSEFVSTCETSFVMISFLLFIHFKLTGFLATMSDVFLASTPSKSSTNPFDRCHNT